MNRLLLIVLIIYSAIATGQQYNKADSIYYLLDTSKTPPLERMWRVYSDSQYKTYEIQCPCLKGDGRPTFFYSLGDKIHPGDPARIVNRAKLNQIRLSGLSQVISISKRIIDTQLISRIFVFIEPHGNNYILHNVALINPAVHITSGPDVVEIPPDTSAFAIKGLISINSKQLSQYTNKSVITNGRVISTRIAEGNNAVWMLIGAEYPNQDFSVLIENENRDKFDLPERFFTGKQIKVTGKVIEYWGKPAIIISEPNQIQWINSPKRKY